MPENLTATTPIPGLPPVPPALPGLPPSLPPIPPPPGGTIEVMGQAVQIDGDQQGTPSPPPTSDVTSPGERPRRTRRTREQMEAARATILTTTPLPEQPVQMTAAPDASPGFTEGPSQVPAAPSHTEWPGDNLRPQNTPPPTPVAEGNAKPKFWASVGATINIGNYESMKFDMGVSGVDYDAPSEEIERIMASAEVGIHETVEALMNKVIDRAREVKMARGLPVGEE